MRKGLFVEVCAFYVLWFEGFGHEDACVSGVNDVSDGSELLTE